MSFLRWLDQTPFAQYIASDTYAYPVLLCFHAVGMGTIVGIVWIMSLRVLGYPRGMALETFAQLTRVALVGFAMNAVSGVMLFIAEAHRMIVNLDFQVKMACIVVGSICAWSLSKTVAGMARRGEPSFPASARIVAVVSALLWLVALVAGRYIAYTLKPPYE